VIHATVVTEDFVFNMTADKMATSRDTLKLAKLRDEYIGHIFSCIKNAEMLGIEVLGRPVRHIIQLHANRINGLFLDDLISALKNRGYTIVSLQSALEDKLYQYKDAYFQDNTVSFLERIKQTNPDQLPALEE
jgi:hypothetical protein